MPNLQRQIDDLDRVVHEPARLAILTVLSACREADFTFLLRVTGLTNGNLSTHLTKLETAGLVSIVKQFAGKRPQTLISLTESGREQIKQHWRRLEELRDQAGKVTDAVLPLKKPALESD
ncbi:MAG TPA: transcriptional regulator [Candidatus Angelobacter sp.]|jgi:DNA-binding MarR family transcriptional regulator|nr:transcriptional regulator [Candidatus Angelobacter sp.]